MKKSILIIDDEMIIRDYLKKLLISDGYEVFLAENGTQGLNVLKEKQKDIVIVILDIKMPGMDGMEVLKKIKEEYLDKEVIMTTGNGDIETAVQSLRQGAFDYISKPIEYEKLILCIIRALEKQDNIIRRMMAENALYESEKKYRTLVEQANEGIAIIQNKIFKYANPCMCKMLGYLIDELIETEIDNYLHSNDVFNHENYFENCFENCLIEKDELVLLKKNGKIMYAEFSMGIITHNNQRANLLIVKDVTERNEYKRKIEYLSFHDSLTGLNNRAFFEHEVERLNIKRQLPLSLIIGDINGLKLVNDAYGHAMGDGILKGVAKIIKNNCRFEDIIARWGGDEFIILLPKTNSIQAEIIVNRINAEIETEKSNFFNGIVSISFGWDTKENIEEDMTNVFKKADSKMYKTKLIESPSTRCKNIKLIVAALFEKSQREEQHSKRVSQLCFLIGQKIGLGCRELNDIKTAGMLHDIGKIALVGNLLDNTEALTDNEWEEIKRHPEIGFRILSTSNDLSEIALGVLAHHEKWDGTGYPKGLKAEEIPLPARIIAVADSFDVMTNDRGNRKKMGQNDAIEEIRKNAGKQFDPDIVMIFITKVLQKELNC